MSDPECIRIEIRTEKDIVLARQTGRNLSIELGYGRIVQSRIATAISELARNIFLYAESGFIEIDIVQQGSLTGLRVIACDQGPGIVDIRKALQDGYSTSGALGAGLPGVKRMMDEFYIDSSEEQGTKVTIIKWKN
ncbi:anti-sigma regulatory factor [Brevibacillus fulvus]|uniref:Serine/threonine-protein kinase RsbT n=1 Tax=Brevibacillus fulvus TaxID=1125967 RepID=A0A939BW98_9BACL|nr:anti-sigma regulatory factor [Brevibacillus fulvus]MBM7591586.1 serine/threonine-protein kinase RsbT [Brevibacillus fulvus]